MSEIVWSEETLKKMKDWSEQADIEPEKIQEAMTTAYNELVKDYPEQEQEFYEQRSRFAVNSTMISPILRSPSKPVMLFVLGMSSVRDIWGKAKSDAIASYGDNPEHAVQNYIVSLKQDAEGKDQPVPLGLKEYQKDGRKSPYFRKPLPYTPQRTVIGVGYPLFAPHQKQVQAAEQSLIKLLHIKVGKLFKDKDTGEYVVNNPEDWLPELLEPAKLHLNLRRPLKTTLLGDFMYLYNDSANLRYKVVPGSEYSEPMAEEGRFKDPSFPFDILQNLPSEFHADIDEVSEWIDNHADDYDTPIVVEGWIANINHYPDEGRSYSIEIQDMQENKLQCWVHNDIYPMIARIGRRTHVMVIGYPSKKDDEASGETRINLNSWGIAIDHKEFYDRKDDPVEQELLKARKEAEKEAAEAAAEEAESKE